MMRIYLLLFVLAASTGLFAQKDRSYQNHRHSSGIDDFNSPTAKFRYSEKGKFYYCLSNDAERLYVNIRIFDSEVQRVVLNSGITLWISTNGKMTRKSGIRYPARIQNAEGSGRQGPPDRQDNPYMQNSQNMQQGRNMPQRGSIPGGAASFMNMNANTMQLIGIGDQDQQTITSFEEGNFRGSIRIENDGNLFYEVIIPFSRLPEISDKPLKKNVSPFLIGISYKTPVAIGGPGGGMPGGGRPGGGMPGGGGSRGSGGGGGMRGGSPGGGAGPTSGTGTAQETLIWIKDIRLAADK